MDVQSLKHQIEEVRYLHSLWHQGPPPNPNPNPNPNPHLRPLALPSFKKTKRKEKKSQWPTGPPPKPPPQTGWADPIPPPTRPATAEEQAKLIAARSQHNALKSSRDFFHRSDSDEDADDEGEDAVEEDGEEESAKCHFFLKLFSDDDDLRSYYEKNFERGEFSCLVCEGTGRRNGKNPGRNLGKKFGGCAALVNHSVSISKPKSRIGKIAHRAFGRVICRVLGWNFNRLPTIVLDSEEEPLGRTLAKSNSQQACSGGNDASNQEKTSEAMDCVGPDKEEIDGSVRDDHTAAEEACSGGNDASNQEKTSEAMDCVGPDKEEIDATLRDDHTADEEACSGGNDASNQEKTSEAMECVGPDKQEIDGSLRDDHTAVEEACSGGNDASNQEKTSEAMDCVGPDKEEIDGSLRSDHTAVEVFNRILFL